MALAMPVAALAPAAALGSGELTAGTQMLFQQSVAPLGWSKVSGGPDFIRCVKL